MTNESNLIKLFGLCKPCEQEKFKDYKYDNANCLECDKLNKTYKFISKEVDTTHDDTKITHDDI